MTAHAHPELAWEDRSSESNDQEDPTRFLARLTAGDENAWDLFSERYSALVYSVAAGVFTSQKTRPHPEDIEEAVQNTYLRLIKDDFRLLKTYDPTRASLTTWLAVVARSTSLNTYKSLNALEPQCMDVPSHANPVFPGAEERLEIPEEILSPRERQIMRLSCVEELTAEEISETTNLQKRTVYNCRSNALKKIRAFFMKGKKRV